MVEGLVQDKIRIMSAQETTTMETEDASTAEFTSEGSDLEDDYYESLFEAAENREERNSTTDGASPRKKEECDQVVQALDSILQDDAEDDIEVFIEEEKDVSNRENGPEDTFAAEARHDEQEEGDTLIPFLSNSLDSADDTTEPSNPVDVSQLSNKDYWDLFDRILNSPCNIPVEEEVVRNDNPFHTQPSAQFKNYYDEDEDLLRHSSRRPPKNSKRSTLRRRKDFDFQTNYDKQQEKRIAPLPPAPNLQLPPFSEEAAEVCSFRGTMDDDEVVPELTRSKLKVGSIKITPRMLGRVKRFLSSPFRSTRKMEV